MTLISLQMHELYSYAHLVLESHIKGGHVEIIGGIDVGAKDNECLHTHLLSSLLIKNNY